MLDVLKETIKDKAKEDKEKRISKRSKKVKFFGKCVLILIQLYKNILYRRI